MNKRKLCLKVHELKNEKGLGRNEISKRLGIPRTTVLRILNEEEPSEFVKCKNCGKTFIPNKYYPNKKFCCDHYRRIYWSVNHELILYERGCGYFFRTNIDYNLT